MTKSEREREAARLDAQATEHEGMASAAYGVGATLDGAEYARMAKVARDKARALRASQPA